MAFSREHGQELPHAIDFKAEIYMRQEAQRHAARHLREGLRAVVAQGDAVEFRHTSCWRPISTASRRRSRSASSTSRRMAKAGIKRIINGPFTFSPDGNPLVGPVQGLRQLSGCACARDGRASARAAASAWRCRNGWSRAIPASTSGRWTWRASANGRRAATPTPRCARIMPGASRIRFPNEELPAARPQQTTALYDVMIAQGRGDGRQLGARDAAVVRAQGRRAEGHRLLPPLQRLSACEGGMPRRCASGVGVTEIANFAKYDVHRPRRRGASCRG